MAHKTFRFNFHGIDYPETVKDDYEESLGQYIKNNLPEEYRKTDAKDSSISLYNEDIHENGDLIYGHLCRTDFKGHPGVSNPDEKEYTELNIADEQGLFKLSGFLIDTRYDIVLLQKGSISLHQFAKFFEINCGIGGIEKSLIVDPKTTYDANNLSKVVHLGIRIKRFDLLKELLGDDLSDDQVLNLADATNTTEIIVELRNKAQGLNKSRVMNLVNRLNSRNLFKEDEIVAKYTISGEHEEDEKEHVYDLVTNRVSDQIRIEVLNERSAVDIPFTEYYDELLKMYTLQHRNQGISNAYKRKS